jgi:hypothetical protein
VNLRLMAAIFHERDQLGDAFPASFHCSRERVFRCELCNRLRPEEQRREPESEICIKCVEEAGFCS